jgi:hypothetical protein
MSELKNWERILGLIELIMEGAMASPQNLQAFRSDFRMIEKNWFLMPLSVRPS